MDLVLGIGVIAALIWSAVVFRYLFKHSLSPIPMLALLTIVCSVVLGYDFFHSDVGPIPVTLDRILLAGIVVLYVLLTMFGYESLQTVTKTDVLVFSFFGFMALSTFGHEWSYRDNLPLSRLLFFNLMPLAMYVGVRNSRLKVADLRVVSLVFSVVGVYLALTAIAELNGWNWMVYPTYIMSESIQEFFGRARGPLLNPVSNGILMTICLCSTLVWWPHVGRRWRALIVAVAPIMILGISATLTRSVWVAAFASLALIVWLPVTRQVRGGLIAITAVAALILVPIFAGQFSSFKRDKFVTEAEMEKSAKLRPLFAVVAGRMLQDRPILGHGYGQYTQAKRPYLKDPTSKYPLYMTKPYMQHNVVLSYLTELGIVGTGLFLMLLLNVCAMARQLWDRKWNDLWVRQFGLLMGVVLICHMINGMFHDVSIAPMGNMILFFFIAITTRLHSSEPENATLRMPVRETERTAMAA